MNRVPDVMASDGVPGLSLRISLLPSSWLVGVEWWTGLDFDGWSVHVHLLALRIALRWEGDEREARR